MLLRFIPVMLSATLLAAHFVRGADYGLAAVSIMGPLLLTLKNRWVLVVLPLILVLGAALWLLTLRDLIALRMALGEPWIRMATILASVAILTLLAGVSLRSRFWRERNQIAKGHAFPASLAFVLTGLSLYFVQTKVSHPMLLAERFWPGGGWVEIFFLSTYAAYITEKMQDRARAGILRRRIWLLFTMVFFGQLLLGLLGAQTFLMTGRLHLPVPAMIAAGPVFRGTRFFMPILFVITLLITGPAWCSHLCYFGSLDNIAALKKKRPTALPRFGTGLRIGILAAVISIALILRLIGTSPAAAALLGGAFGLVGLGVILLWSRKTGVMTHCTVYCPIGLLANLAGKLSPFRINIGPGCNDCGACARACRYDALGIQHIARRKPGFKCTLCGDCISRCKESHLAYSFLGYKGDNVRGIFIALIVALHSVFLGVARI